jgi:segregation and condensation protein B
VLFASDKPLGLAQLRELVGERDAEVIRPALAHLAEHYAGRGLVLAEIAGGWQFRTAPANAPWVQKLLAGRPVRLSRPQLETLAIIAYRQPVTRGDIEDIRGVTVSTQIIQTLEHRGWIDIVGHRETPGRPALYATTRGFLDDLGLRSLQELPPLEEVAKTLQLEPAPVQQVSEAEVRPAEDQPAPEVEPFEEEPPHQATGTNG